MKTKILRRFKDKNTGEIYIPEMEVEFTEERVEEILKKGKLLEKIVETEQNEETEQSKETEQRKSTTKRRNKKEEELNNETVENML